MDENIDSSLNFKKKEWNVYGNSTYCFKLLADDFTIGFAHRIVCLQFRTNCRLEDDGLERWMEGVVRRTCFCTGPSFISYHPHGSLAL